MDTNHPNDLDIEHQNKSLKDQAHSYQESNFSYDVSRSAVITKNILTNDDKLMKVFHQSGKHTSTNINDDILTLIKQIHERRVYSFIPGRSYIGLQDIAANPFHKLDGDSLRDWVSSSLKIIAQEHFY